MQRVPYSTKETVFYYCPIHNAKEGEPTQMWLSTDKQTMKMWHIYTIEWFSCKEKRTLEASRKMDGVTKYTEVPHTQKEKNYMFPLHVQIPAYSEFMCTWKQCKCVHSIAFRKEIWEGRRWCRRLWHRQNNAHQRTQSYFCSVSSFSFFMVDTSINVIGSESVKPPRGAPLVPNGCSECRSSQERTEMETGQARERPV